MDEIERLRADVKNAEITLNKFRGMAENDERVHLPHARNPDDLGKLNAERIRHFEERVKAAQARLDAALTTGSS